MFLDNRDARHLRHEVRESIDRNQAVLAEIQRLVVIGSHQTEEALHAVVDVTERSRLLAVSPDLNFRIARQFRNGDLATQSGRCFFTAALPGS